MSNFLAIDTGGKYLSVIASAQGKIFRHFLPDCAMKHSVLLMDEIDNVFKEAGISARDCDFFAAVCGPGSFTGIRIGIATVKGFCVALEKPALSLTSFDALAYAERKIPLLALVDAGHNCFYACAYDREKNIVQKPAYLAREEVEKLIGEGFLPVASEPLFEGCRVLDPCEGLKNAVLVRQGEIKAPSKLLAVYLRKSSAEEKLS